LFSIPSRVSDYLHLKQKEISQKLLTQA